MGKLKCDKCNGTGEVDWVKNVMWQKHNKVRLFEKFTLSILKKPYPKLIVDQLFTVKPMEAPELVKGYKND